MKQKTNKIGLVPNGPGPDAAPRNEKRDKITKRLLEIYGGRYGYRTTASGNRVSRDEPNTEQEQFLQSDAIAKKLRLQRAQKSREELKNKNAVPTKNGKKLFEDFCKEAYLCREKQLLRENAEILSEDYLLFANTFRNLYASGKLYKFRDFLKVFADVLETL